MLFYRCNKTWIIMSSNHNSKTRLTTTNNNNSLSNKTTTTPLRLMSSLCPTSSRSKFVWVTTRSRLSPSKSRSNRDQSHTSAVTETTAPASLSTMLSPRPTKLSTTTQTRMNVKSKPTNTRQSPLTWCVSKELKWKRLEFLLIAVTIRLSIQSATSRL